MATITAAGTGSGLDIENIITKLVEAESVPVQERLALRETEIQAEISAFGSLKSALSDFRKSLTNLSSLQGLAARAAKSSNESSFTVSANNTASVGSSQIEVVNLASAHKLISTANFASPDAAVGAGRLTISVGSESFDVDIIGGQNNTLAGIRDAINEKVDNSGVTASILTVSDGMGGTVSKLVLSADETGAANAISVAVTGDSDTNDLDNAGLSAFLNANMDQAGDPLDALIRVDGYDVTSSDNVLEDAIQGVTITLLEANPGVDETLDVSINKSAIKENLTLFVENFNALADTLNFLTDYDAETQEAGLLTGDSTVRSIENLLRRTITNAVSELGGTFNSLASIGITTQRDGSLKLDSAKLDKALNGNFDEVAELLGGENGIAKKLDGTLNNILKSGGMISTRNNTFLEQLKDIDAQREKLEMRMTSLEERLRAQYSAMDLIVANLNSTGDYITQQMESISQITKKK